MIKAVPKMMVSFGASFRSNLWDLRQIRAADLTIDR